MANWTAVSRVRVSAMPASSMITTHGALRLTELHRFTDPA
jgi:hypothetical protein